MHNLENKVVSPSEEKKVEKKHFKFTWKSFFFSFIWLFVLMLALDIASKWLVQLNCKVDSPIAVIPGFFYISLSYNTGAAGGTGAGILGMRIFYAVISWVMSFAFIFYFVKHLKDHNSWMNSILMLCLSGAVGNLIDRTFYFESTIGVKGAGVIDFLQFYLLGADGQRVTWINPFPTFNVADACLTIGIISLFVYLLVEAIKAKKADKAKEDSDE